MRHRPAHGRLLPAVLALTAALTATSAVIDPITAQAADSLQCRTTASIFTVVPDSRLFLWGHHEPETGVASWQTGQELGSGWGQSTWGGPDGRIYTVSETGELHRRRWANGAWEGGGPSAYTVIGTGFTTYRNAAYRNKFTVDSLGHFYAVDPSGFLRWRSYNETTGTWQEAVLDAGWDQYDMITAAGNGILYARTTSGFLYRYEYHAGSQRLSGSTMVGSGDWGGFVKIFSPGGDVLYAVRPTGQMLWYRYVVGSGLATGSGREIGNGGWAADPATVATTDDCKLTTTNEPQRPAVTADRAAPAVLAKTGNGYLQYGYVNTEGRLVHGEIRDLYNVNPNGFAVIPGYAGFTGKPSYAENENGQLRLYAHGTDADARGSLQTSPGVWNGLSYFAGRMKTSPRLVRTTNDLVTFVALDEQGYIWVKPQRVLNASIHAWRRHTYQNPLPVAPAGPLEARADGSGIRLTALGVNGVTYTYWISASAEVTLRVPPSPWTSLGNPAGALATSVPLPDGAGEVWFTRADDGQVWTKRTGATAWTVLPATTPPGVTAVGTPSAIMAPNGTLQVAVRGSDGFVYRTGQANPGSGTWLPWTEITQYEYESAVDPTLSLAADTWVVAFRTPAGDPKLRRFQPTTTAARTADAAGTFVEVPLVVAK
ncbi:hypothetical protein LZG04_09555 [Saccharothrix sp. S26]|uniref:tachylectin-related carbohydrate-binding protein n=1 Tax=Saccharothrix sp. S26 TaxID=2907215 RepID=UPI001EEDA17F|nr:tachylectin-related carbohydrate-binding protein [Saccharothrix sp. S26]MCE6995052.1 hypothetical protein [Saccharothrix sp. S26]